MTIIDAFLLFNELDLLEIRLIELYPVVDWFVLVESTKTHSGKPKPLHYAANRQRFARWNDKIRHVVIADWTDEASLAATRRREMGQRNEILQGLRGDPDDALVLISDIDEIPRREIVAGLSGNIPDGTIGVFIQKLHYYNVNTSAPERPWPGTRVANLRDVVALSPHIIRNGIGQPDAYYPIHGRIANGGWHYSYFGGIYKIQEKMDAFLHQELVSGDHSDLNVIARRAAIGQDVWGRQNEQQFVIGPASDLPWAIRADPKRWLHFFHEDWQPEFNEDWYTAEQAAYVGWLAQQAPQDGAIVEIGCWEGRSTVCIAQSVAPRLVIAVDHFEGNTDEGDSHPATEAAQERDVADTFNCNMTMLTSDVRLYPYDWRKWLDYWKYTPNTWTKDGKIAFLHLDAAHDYDSVADCLRAVLPFLVPGAILCGDDLYADGVYRAVHDVLGDDVKDVGGRLWVWQKEV